MKNLCLMRTPNPAMLDQLYNLQIPYPPNFVVHSPELLQELEKRHGKWSVTQYVNHLPAYKQFHRLRDYWIECLYPPGDSKSSFYTLFIFNRL